MLVTDTVLVTGGTGFVGAWCIAALLQQGYRVRTTVRSRPREAGVRAAVAAAGAEGELEAVEADLARDDGWTEAAAGARYVLHVASPFPATQPTNPAELIEPARDGTLRVLRAAQAAGAERVVLTSSFAAVGYGHPDHVGPYTEADWTDPDGPGVSAYAMSKTLAERAAWEFVQGEGGIELAVVNPVAILGPALSDDLSTSLVLMRSLASGTMRRVPRASIGVVDVRDVADLHVRAMTVPAAAGERFLAVAGDPISYLEMARVVAAAAPEVAAAVPSRTVPDWIVRTSARFNPSLRPVAAGLGTPRVADAQKARRMLGWTPRSNEETVAASAQSLHRLGLLGPAGQTS